MSHGMQMAYALAIPTDRAMTRSRPVRIAGLCLCESTNGTGSGSNWSGH